MKKYDYKEIKNKFDNEIIQFEKDIFILKTISKAMEENSKKFNYITIRIEEYFQGLFKNNKYNLTCYYRKNNYTYISNNNKKLIHFSDNNGYYFDLELEYNSEITHRKISAKSLKEEIQVKENRIKEIKNILKTLKSKTTKFNKIMDTLDNFYKENKELNYYLKVKEY